MAKPVPPSSTRSENTTAVCVVCGKLVRLGGAYDYERRADLPPRLPRTKEERNQVTKCHICNKEVPSDEICVCSGCVQATCYDCMTESDFCKECTAE